MSAVPAALISHPCTHCADAQRCVSRTDRGAKGLAAPDCLGASEDVLSGLRVAVVEDDAQLTGMLRSVLEIGGAEVETFGDGLTALAAFRASPPDLVVTDLWLPGIDGLALGRALRATESTACCGLVVITGSLDEAAEVVRDIGADDYVTKPFRVPTLLDRLRRLMARRSAWRDKATLRLGDIVVDATSGSVRVAGRTVRLSPTELALLYTLGEQRGRVLSGSDLLGRDLPLEALRLADLHVDGLRTRLGSARTLIEKVPGGYRFAV